MRRDGTQITRSRRLRRESTPAEKILWGSLRGRRFCSYKFRRQYALERFILDFYCPALKLAVELDGQTHVGKEEHDAERQQVIESSGIRVLRFWNPDVYEHLDQVLQAIWNECEIRAQSGPLTRRASGAAPSPRGGEGKPCALRRS
ncbi:MAG TPA: DUF559 domain-containing protein [Planctomycetota bacterium]|jgi:very-short-patch-repair endonuclease